MLQIKSECNSAARVVAHKFTTVKTKGSPYTESFVKGIALVVGFNSEADGAFGIEVWTVVGAKCFLPGGTYAVV